MYFDNQSFSEAKEKVTHSLLPTSSLPACIGLGIVMSTSQVVKLINLLLPSVMAP